MISEPGGSGAQEWDEVHELDSRRSGVFQLGASPRDPLLEKKFGDLQKRTAHNSAREASLDLSAVASSPDFVADR